MSEDIGKYAEVYGNLKAIHGEAYASEVAHTVNCMMIAEKMMLLGMMHDAAPLMKLGELLVNSVAIHNRVFCDEGKYDLKSFVADKNGFQAIIEGKNVPCDPSG